MYLCIERYPIFKHFKYINMKYHQKLISIFVILLVFLNTLSAQTTKINQIDSLMKRPYHAGLFNGNVLVSKNNKIIYNASFGFTDATKTKKLNPDYRFNIGSITKEFSAVAVMQMQEKGKLNLDDKVSKFIPELPQWANEVQIKDLLRYTSGIPNVNWKKIKNDKDLFDGLMQIDTLDFKPGTDYDYNNNNIFLRQFIVERLTGMPYKKYVEKFIFRACKMSTSIVTPFENEDHIARGFNNNLVQDKPDLPITGGTYLTTVDLLKWADCLHKNKIINVKAIYELGQQFNLQETQSALGQAKYTNEKLIQHLHDGRAGNYEAILVSEIDEQFTIILLGNNYNGKIFDLSDAISAVLKDQKSSNPTKN